MMMMRMEDEVTWFLWLCYFYGMFFLQYAMLLSVMKCCSLDPLKTKNAKTNESKTTKSKRLNIRHVQVVEPCEKRGGIRRFAKWQKSTQCLNCLFCQPH